MPYPCVIPWHAVFAAQPELLRYIDFVARKLLQRGAELGSA